MDKKREIEAQEAQDLPNVHQSNKRPKMTPSHRERELLEAHVDPFGDVEDTRHTNHDHLKGPARPDFTTRSLNTPTTRALGFIPYHKQPSIVDVGSNSPPLPQINDPQLETAVFTHSSVVSDYDISSSKDSSLNTYERLEFLGDAYLEVIATRIIFSRFPFLSVGKQAQLRESLVKNDALLAHAKFYKFDERLRITAQERSSAKAWKKILADVFEAYIAAVILSDPQDGFTTVEIWLTQLWSPQLLAADSNRPATDHDAKNEIWRMVSGPGVKVDYINESEPTLDRRRGKYHFTIGCYFTGWGHSRRRLGVGQADNKAKAGFAAASEALKINRALLEEAQSKKREWQRAKETIGASAEKDNGNAYQA